MKKLGKTPEYFESFNTCQHNGRVFHFSEENEQLVVTEAILSDKAEFVRVVTGEPFYLACEFWISCCSFGQSILVMGSGDGKYSAVLVKVDEGRLSESTIHVTSLTVSWDKKWSEWPFLCRVADSRALLYFFDRNGMWYCDIAGIRLTIRKCNAAMSTSPGFDTVAICLPDGRLLAAGLKRYSTDITLVTTNGKPTFKKVGDVPGAERMWTAMTLVKNRFVVGFGGNTGENDLDDLWIFDLQTRQSSQVRKKGDWHPKDSLTLLVVQNDTLYLASGLQTMSVNSLPLSSLAGLIVSKNLRLTFHEAIGFMPFAAYTGKACLSLLPPLL